MSRDLLGLRVLVRKDGGLVYGVARVRYNEGHTYAGNYEIETADGTSFLAPLDTCTVGANWDVTPEEGRFTGAQFFRPQFLAGVTTQDGHLFSRSHGVVVPSDLPRLRKLAAIIEKGQTINWYSHGSNEFRGDLKVTSVNSGGITLKSGKTTRVCTWPTTGEAKIGPQYATEFLVENNRIRFLLVSPKRYGTGVTDSVTLTIKERGRL